MHYDISYKNLTKHEADTKAIQDIKEYLGQKRWHILLKAMNNPDLTIEELNIMFGFMGVSGYPFHAFCRKYKLAKYRDWMNSGDNPVITDDEGFRIASGE